MAEGLQRAANAASESRRATTGKPAKPWRVYGTSLPEDYRNEKGAYAAVAELIRWGHSATVWHWADGAWQLYERVEANETGD